MQRREIRYVVKNAAENKVVGPGIHRRCAEEEDGACDKDVKVGIGLVIRDEEVVVVPGTVLAENESSDKKSCCPRQEEPDAEGAVFHVILPDVEDTGNEEEDCESNGGAFDWGIKPKRAGDCRLALGTLDL